MQMIWMLLVQDRYGDRTMSAHSSEEKALEALDFYVREHWEDAFQDDPMPNDSESRVSAYFEVVRDSGRGEDYLLLSDLLDQANREIEEHRR